MTRSKDKKLSADWREAYCRMIAKGRQSGLTIPSEAEYEEKFMKFLMEKLKTTTMEGVIRDDICRSSQTRNEPFRYKRHDDKMEMVSHSACVGGCTKYGLIIPISPIHQNVARV
jgi:hypothetical protein